MDAEDDEGRTALIEAREQEHPAVLLTLAHVCVYMYLLYKTQWAP